MKVKTKVLLLVFITLMLTPPAFAGWVAEVMVKGIEGEEYTEVLYIQNNKMKNVGHDQIMMFDLEKKLFYIISPDPAQKLYWGGTPEQWKKEMEGTKTKMEEEYLKQMTPEQKEAYEKYKKSMKGGEAEAPKEKKLNVNVKKTSEKATIAGYPTQKYQVWVDGQLKEEMWISTKIQIKDEFDMRKLEELQNEFGGPEEEVSYESSPEYMAIMEQGIPLKTIDYYEGGSEVREFKKIEKKQIPDSEFEVPKGYRKISIFDLQQLQEATQGR